MKSSRIHHILLALGWAAGLTVAGACLGAVVYPLFGALAGNPRPAASLAWHGARDLGFLTFIWAPGIGIVVAFHRAWSRRRAAGGAPRADG